MRDFVVKRKDGIPSYQIASLIDDTHFGINLIVRGEDLLASTAAQRWLAANLTTKSFLDAHFLHHPIALEGGAKLSKSAGATSLKTMRENGSGVSAVYHKLSEFLGFPEKASSAQEALAIWKTA